MKDQSTTNAELTQELASLRQRIAELERTLNVQPDEAWQTREPFFQIITDSVPALIAYVDAEDLRYRFVNRHYEDFFEKPRATIIGRQVREIIGEENYKFALPYIESALSGKAMSYENLFTNSRGRSWFKINYVPDIDKFGIVKGIFVLNADITERRQVEETLHLITDNMSDMIRVADLQGVNLYVSPSHAKVLGYKPEERVGRSVFDIVHPDDLENIINVFSEGLAHKRPAKAEYRIMHAEGHYVWLETIGDMLRNDQGEVTAVILTSRNVTERKQAEEALRESEERYRTILNEMEEGYQEVDLAGNFTFFNETFLKLFGYSSDEMMGMNFRCFAAEEAIAKKVYLAYNEMYKTGLPIKSYEWDIIRKDGARRTIEFYASVLRDSRDRPTGFRGIVRDITDHKQAEKQLQHTLESLRKAVGATIQVMVSAVEVRDPYTSGHQLRSANLARAVATEMGFTQDRIEGVGMVGSIHDIGKLSIPAETLSKPTKLTNIELALIREHALKGYEMLKDVESPWPLAEIVYQHHERMDGSGYPRNLKGDDILMEARILGVADVVESMASHRPCRPALGLKAALAEIENNRGTLYDADVADACLRLFREKDFHLEGA
jgi:PAS domain S-box-containing protein